MNNIKMIFKKNVHIRFHDADPAGIMYFANIFTLAHNCFEDFIVNLGIPWKTWFMDNKYLVPVKHAESDFQFPFFAGENYEIVAKVAKISNSSFKMHYTFHQNNRVNAIVQIVHTYVDPQTMKKISIPSDMRTLLEKYLEEVI